MAVDKIISVNIEEEMKTAYIDYSMSVIISRALPDVRDGLKPVQEGFCTPCPFCDWTTTNHLKRLLVSSVKF